jgi:hypothetical protein
VVWTGLMWFRVGTGGGLLETVVNLPVPLNVEKFLSHGATGDFRRRANLHGVS